MNAMNRQIVLASRPKDAVAVTDFRLVESPMPSIADGEVLVRNHWLSLDPYMRGRMDEAESYAATQELDAVMVGGTAGEVIESRDPRFAVGDSVVGFLGWQLYAASGPRGLQKVDTTRVPLSAYLGAAGMPGITAWYGLNRIIAPRAGETIVVSAASGAVGSVVGQLAKRAGCRVVGIAGGAQKCAIVTGEYGFDACIDYKAGRLHDDLRDATPDGIDGNFENVGGEILDAVLRRMNAFGRVAVCGLISGYDEKPVAMKQFRSVLVNRLRVEGFIVSDHMDAWPVALRELVPLVAGGELKYRETVAHGLEQAPQAFIGLFEGRNVGKQLVKLV